MLTVRV